MPRNANNVRSMGISSAPTQELHPMAGSWSFSQWGLDLVGKINPSSSNGHKFILTTIKYFTKWIEVVPLTMVTGNKISSFILNYIICRYGVSMTIITDNGRLFKNQDMKEVCE